MVNSLAREKILFLLSLLLIASSISGLPIVHAPSNPSGPGTVCLVDTSAVSSLAPPGPCTSGPYTFDAPFPSSPQTGATQIRIGVYINGSGALGGFTVILNATHTVLKAAGVDFTGSVLQSGSGPPQIFAECLDLILVKGPACNGADGLDTLGLSAGVALGAPNTLAPTTGLLFTAIFNVTGTASSGGVPISFQQNNQFCATSSTTQAGQAGNYCVFVSQPPGNTPIAEFVQTGTVFNNNACATTCSIPWVAVGSNATQVNVIQGAASGLSVSITATPENGWAGLSTDSITFTAVTTPSSFTAPTFVGGVDTCSPGGTGTPACPVTIAINTATAGTYSVTIYGTYVAFDANTITETLVGTESIIVNVGSVAWTINSVPSGSGQALYMARGASNPMGLLFTVQSLGQYSGTITYATSLGGVGLTIIYPAPFTLSAGATTTKTINVTATNYGNVLYRAKLTATGLSVLTSGVLTIHVTGVSLSTNSTSVSFPSGATAHVSVTVNSLPASTAGFAGAVTVTNVISGPSGSNRLTVSCPASIMLTAGASGSGTCSLAGSLSGTYTVTIKILAGANNAITNSTIVTAMIQAGTGPGINIDASPVSVTTNVNNLATSTVTMASRNGLTGTVDLLVTVTGSATCLLNPTSITLGTSSTSVLSCNDAVPETVTATVTATNSTNASITNSTDVSYIFQDFAITAVPMNVPADAGSAGMSTINTMGLNGFSGPIDLATNSTSCSVSPTRLTGTGSATLSCTFSSASTFHVIVTGTNDTLSHSVTVTFTVQGFSIAANPTIVPASVGAQGVSTITVSSLNGFTRTVGLAVTMNSTNLSCNLTTTSLPSGSGSSTLSCSAGVGGNYNATVTGTSGGLSHSVSVIYHVSLNPDFSITGNPTGVSVNVGGKGNSTIVVSGFNGFNSLVTFSTNSSSCISPTSVTGSGSATLSCTFNSISIVHVNVTGTSGGLSHSVVVIYTVQDFTVTANPASVTANISVAKTSTVTITAANGFIGTVTLSVNENSTDLTCNLSPVSVTGGSGVSSLSCTGSVPGNYLATVTATNGTLSHSADVVYHVVNAPTFTVTASLTSVAVNAGVTGTSTITVTPQNGFTDTVTLAVATNSTNLSCSLSPTTITGGSGSSTLSCSASQAGNYQATVTGTNANVSPTPASATVIYQVQDFSVTAGPAGLAVNAGLTETSTITIGPTNGFTGTVDLSVSISKAGLTGSLSTNSVPGGSGSSTLTLVAKTLGNYTVTVTASTGSLYHYATINVQVGDFSITQLQSQITINETSSGSVIFTFTSDNGFNGQVGLVGYSCLLNPAIGGTLCVSTTTGLLPTVNPSPTLVNLSPGTPVNVQINVVVGNNVYPGLWGVGVNATVGSNNQVHLIQLTVPQPFISIVADPGSVYVGPGVTASMTLTITSEYGLSGTVTFALSPLTGANCSLAQNSLSLSRGGSATTGLTCSGTVGSYNETITGTGTAPYGSPVSKNGYAAFNVVDFTLTSTPSGGIVVNLNQTGHARISITWPGGYDGIVDFTIVPTSGLDASISSSRITGSGFLNVTVISNLGGSYTLVVNATTGPVVNGVMTVAAFHLTRLTVTVLSPSQAGNILGVDPTTFFSIVGILVVAVAASGLLISRRRKSAKKKRRS